MIMPKNVTPLMIKHILYYTAQRIARKQRFWFNDNSPEIKVDSLLKEVGDMQMVNRGFVEESILNFIHISAHLDYLRLTNRNDISKMTVQLSTKFYMSNFENDNQTEIWSEKMTNPKPVLAVIKTHLPVTFNDKKYKRLFEHNEPWIIQKFNKKTLTISVEDMLTYSKWRSIPGTYLIHWLSINHPEKMTLQGDNEHVTLYE